MWSWAGITSYYHFWVAGAQVLQHFTHNVAVPGWWYNHSASWNGKEHSSLSVPCPTKLSERWSCSSVCLHFSLCMTWLERCESRLEAVSVVYVFKVSSAEMFCKHSCHLVQFGRSASAQKGVGEAVDGVVASEMGFKPHGKLGCLWGYWGLANSFPKFPVSACCLVVLRAGLQKQVSSSLDTLLFICPFIPWGTGSTEASGAWRGDPSLLCTPSCSFLSSQAPFIDGKKTPVFLPFPVEGPI